MHGPTRAQHSSQSSWEQPEPHFPLNLTNTKGTTGYQPPIQKWYSSLHSCIEQRHLQPAVLHADMCSHKHTHGEHSHTDRSHIQLPWKALFHSLNTQPASSHVVISCGEIFWQPPSGNIKHTQHSGSEKSEKTAESQLASTLTQYKSFTVTLISLNFLGFLFKFPKFFKSAHISILISKSLPSAWPFSLVGTGAAPPVSLAAWWHPS